MIDYFSSDIGSVANIVRGQAPALLWTQLSSEARELLERRQRRLTELLFSDHVGDFDPL